MALQSVAFRTDGLPIFSLPMPYQWKFSACSDERGGPRVLQALKIKRNASTESLGAVYAKRCEMAMQVLSTESHRKLAP